MNSNNKGSGRLKEKELKKIKTRKEELDASKIYVQLKIRAWCSCLQPFPSTSLICLLAVGVVLINLPLKTKINKKK